MLEEALNSSTLSVSDASSALLSFLKHELPLGGTSAEVRFCRVFPSICNRVFGSSDPQTPNDIGWLYNIRKSQPSLDLEPLVKFLEANHSEKFSLIDTISAETVRRPGVRFAYPIALLPFTRREKRKKPANSSNKSAANGSSNEKGKEKVESAVMLSMLEFYLLTFCRFPSVCMEHEQNKQRSNIGNNKYGAVFYRDQIYLRVFHSYVSHLLPHADVETKKLECDAELFLRVVNEFLFQGENSVLSKDMITQRLVKQKGKIQAQPNDTSSTAYDAFDATQLTTKYKQNHALVQKAIHCLVVHLIADPKIKSCLQYRTSDMPQCLTPPMMNIQQSFFNYVRMVLKYAPVHLTDSPFFTALETWLIWLEPWNVIQNSTHQIYLPERFASAISQAKSLISSPSSSSISSQPATYHIPRLTSSAPSKYSPKWEPYIAANLHLYTAPLAIFLRRSKELDFSPKEFQKSLTIVKRVLRVFSAPLMEAISRHSNSRFTLHDQILGDFCPSSPVDLAASKVDGHQLLEEIILQEKKMNTFMYSLSYNLQGLAEHCGLVAAKDTEVRKLIQKVQAVLKFPEGYQVFTDDTVNHSHNQASITSPERCQDGVLTNRGREEILSGRKKCSPLDVVAIGDPLKARAKTYEISMLVKWSAHASFWLNEKLGFDEIVEEENLSNSSLFLKLLKEGEQKRKIWFRINLRFLADVRVWTVFLFGAFMLKMF